MNSKGFQLRKTENNQFCICKAMLQKLMTLRTLMLNLGTLVKINEFFLH